MLSYFPTKFNNLIEDQKVFVKSLFQFPGSTGAVAPSSSILARHMAAQIPDASLSKPVIELGPGTGRITKEIIQRGIGFEQLTCVEYSAEFVSLMQKKYPDLHIVQGDAYNFTALVKKNSLSKPGAIVSSLPLLTQPKHIRKQLIEDALAFMGSDGVFIQYSYGIKPPVEINNPEINVSCSKWVLFNLPPARVWVYRLT